MTKRPYNKEYYDSQPKYQGANQTVAKGGQIGAIAQDGKTVIELYEYFCLRHPVVDIKRSNPKYQAYKMMPIKMGQGTVEGSDPKGTKIIYFKSCPKCHQVIIEGEYIKHE